MEGGDQRRGREPARRQHVLDAGLHLARRLVGKRDGENLPRRYGSALNQVSDAKRDDARLARPRAGQNQQRPIDGLDRFALLGIQLVHYLINFCTALNCGESAVRIISNSAISRLEGIAPACVSRASATSLLSRLRDVMQSTSRKTSKSRANRSSTV